MLAPGLIRLEEYRRAGLRAAMRYRAKRSSFKSRRALYRAVRQRVAEEGLWEWELTGLNRVLVENVLSTVGMQ